MHLERLKAGLSALVATCVTGDVLRRAKTLSQESHWSQGSADSGRSIELTDGVSVPPQECAHMGAVFSDIALTVGGKQLWWHL